MTEHCWITVSIHATLRRAPASILDSKVDSTNFMGFRIPSRKIHKCPTAAQRRKLARPSYYTVHNLPLFRNSHNWDGVVKELWNNPQANEENAGTPDDEAANCRRHDRFPISLSVHPGLSPPSPLPSPLPVWFEFT
jgi:hypothetical protein